MGNLVSDDSCDEYVPSLEAHCLVCEFVNCVDELVYQQSSQVESYFSTADYTWLLLMTGGVVMGRPGSLVPLSRIGILFVVLLACFWFVCLLGAPVSASRLYLHRIIVGPGEGADQDILTAGDHRE